MIWQGMCGNGRIVNIVRKLILCAAVRGLILLIAAGVRSASTTSRVSASTSWGFVVPGLNTLFFYPFTLYIKYTVKTGRWIRKGA